FECVVSEDGTAGTDALSLHDALPISRRDRREGVARGAVPRALRDRRRAGRAGRLARDDAVPADAGAGAPPHPRGESRAAPPRARSEEHTSELQSRENLVCRLLLEKRK